MAFPSNDLNGTTAAARLVAIAKALRFDAQKYMDQCDALAVNAHDLISAFCINHLVQARSLWNTLKDVLGVPGVIRSWFPGSFADDAAVSTALTEALTQIDATIAYIVTNTPVDGSGYTLTLKVVNNAFQQRVVTNATQCVNLKTQLTALRDAFSA